MIHFLLPFIIILIAILHIILLHESGSNNPLGIRSNSDRIPFHIYFSTKDIIGLTIITTLLLLSIMFFPNIVNDPENFIEANLLITPTHIQPE